MTTMKKLKKFLKSPLREIHEYADIRREYESVLKHLDRHHNEIIFIKISHVVPTFILSSYLTF